ncbi:protein phnG [Microlunatus endophyticus]|uniref:Protein phnG n=1 Tax=Microlunatus endophyticus TaxID=1716077 RepID=A0A917SDS0_9ACTN|nr:phosphonate C-P lyase system protein PhnG [Microlunatus endophyticus]GGL73146.1 protein phnG [Microlunatus endophyticus]
MSEATAQEAEEIAMRQRAAGVLAGASTAELAECWNAWPNRPEVEYLRGPESGLVMVQGRIGGSGDRFNLGEATVVRATALVRGGGLATECVGTSYVLGSDPDHAGLAAVFQALLADPGQRDLVLQQVIEPLQSRQATVDAGSRAQARATTVNFFTVARENSGGVEEDDE